MTTFAFTLINWALVTLVTICFINLYLALKVKEKSALETVINWAIWFLSIHAVYVLIVSTFFHRLPYLDWAAPFGLVYGPLYFLGVQSTIHHRLSRRKTILHFIPFLIFLAIFVAGIPSAADPHAYNAQLIRQYLYKVTAVSFISYSLLGAYLSRRNQFHRSLLVGILGKASFMLLLASFIYFAQETYRTGSYWAYSLPRLSVYSLLILFALLIFNHKVTLLRKAVALDRPPEDEAKAAHRSVEKRSYAKSALSKTALQHYQEKLETCIHDEQLFLDASLTIERLGDHLNIPKHHLSQVFNTQIGKSFTSYMNEARINFACRLLEQESNTPIEQLAYQSGFNSKVSFYRQFKNKLGCTPSEYQRTVKSRE
ncbi:AraC family transcriptional regulator [Olivibacter sp. XZL3]|uniref:helix-turn-helix domain-containing protein n=1 Tax=Olivibacter sp. XZL3 TaxID=1735116 RepID=UPI001065D4AA|nr:helix-turn-helix domain-containing protein [Olivibacter sp. XZL3]